MKFVKPRVGNLTAFIFVSLLFSVAKGDTVVSRNGVLRAEGNRVVNEEGDPVSLAGNSFFWSQWDTAGFWNPKCVEWLVKDWNSSIIRAAMGLRIPVVISITLRKTRRWSGRWCKRR